MNRRQTSGRSRVVLLAFGLALGALGLEVALRVAAALDRNTLDALIDVPPPDPRRALTLADLIRPVGDDRIVYALRPGASGSFMGRPVSINALGMRDVERPIARDARTFRVVGLGDSHMFGWGVRREETFPAVLEEMLNQRFSPRRFEVWNLAVPGYDSVQEVETFAAEAPLLRPDLVVINWVANDMDLPSFLATPPDVWSIRRSFLIDLIHRRLRARRGRSWRGRSAFRPSSCSTGTLRSSREPGAKAKRLRWRSSGGAPPTGTSSSTRNAAPPLTSAITVSSRALFGCRRRTRTRARSATG